MILVADSGSSSSDWMLNLPDSSPLFFKTKGLNPFFVTEKEIERVIREVPEIIPYADEVKEVYFFGAGCITPDRREIVSNALTVLFPNAFVAVESDLLGAAFATCNNKKGLVATLGTGSDISLFDGEDLLPSHHGIGFILGDEGSGAWFGKRLIVDFLYGNMPKDLSKDFAAKYRLNKEIVIKNVYQKDRPNSYLGSFAMFMADHRAHPYIDQLLSDGFDEFVRTNIMTYPNYWEYTCNFVGHIAFSFDIHLHKVCNLHGIKIGKILANPIQELFDFIIERESNNVEY